MFLDFSRETESSARVCDWTQAVLNSRGGKLMSLRIGTNVASLTAQRMLAQSQKRSEHAAQAISSGSRIVTAGDDAAAFAISERLRGQASSLKAAKNNVQGAVGLVQVAEGGLNEQNNILIRLRELAVQAASDTVGEEERGFIDLEFQQLTQEFDRIARTTVYGNKPLLEGSGEEFEFHLGTQNNEEDVVRYTLDADTTSSALGVEGLSVSDQDDAGDALSDIDEALTKIAGVRANFGAIQSRFEIASNNIDLQRENVMASRSRIADADIAFETSELVAGQVQQQLGIAVLAQANQLPARAVNLL
jgi:flagellin